MRTSEESLREQSARFSAMAEMARADGNVGLADLLTEAARRTAVFETAPPATVPVESETAQAEQVVVEFQQAAE
jgi:hypothetical protein